MAGTARPISVHWAGSWNVAVLVAKLRSISWSAWWPTYMGKHLDNLHIEILRFGPKLWATCCTIWAQILVPLIYKLQDLGPHDMPYRPRIWYPSHINARLLVHMTGHLACYMGMDFDTPHVWVAWFGYRLWAALWAIWAEVLMPLTHISQEFCPNGGPYGHRFWYTSRMHRKILVQMMDHLRIDVVIPHA